MAQHQAILEPEGTYHIFNRANGDELLFRNEDNYLFFLRKYRHYITAIADTLAYCLMPNHFHFVVRMRSEKELRKIYTKMHSNRSTKVQVNLQGFQNLEGFTTQQFSNFFNSYSKAYNKYYKRNGSLFAHTFKRKPITSEKYLKKLIHYIHFNPVEAGLAVHLDEWRFSSYKAILSKTNTLINRQVVMDLFEDEGNFLYCHLEPPDISGIE